MPLHLLAQPAHRLLVAVLLLPRVVSAAEPASKTASVPPVPFSGLSPEATYMLGTVGFGSLAGWSVGFTLKKFAKMAALLVGIVFIAVQALAYHHFIAVDWEKINALVPDNKLHELWYALMGVLTYNFPFAGSFFIGFYLGFRKG